MGKAMGGMDMASRKQKPPQIQTEGNTLNPARPMTARMNRKLAI